ncbi:leucine rich repeat protein [Toxoplasma gondii VAND]|uniref:Leucine rich repeat protein n=1 Tax=Toxoplasma gondii VAND TaxID=933077 RepID=A0A086QCQ5_TOXGO|nr:leucine rich repeat protein [Toxoplasma gondii VAND]
MLKSNKALVALDLEGNHFGLASAKAFRKALEVNDTLRSLNVENCSFTCRGDEQSGVVELAKGLRLNKGLRNLNLRNNQIDDVSMHRAKHAGMRRRHGSNILINYELGSGRSVLPTYPFFPL